INGKLDRKALPTPQFVSEDSYVAPRNEREAQLCHLWQAVLGVKKVGIHDNFFRIGGDSIVSIQLVSKMRRAGFTLQVKAIFDAPTIAQLSHLLKRSQTHIKIEAEQGVLTGKFDLLPIQSWFFEQTLEKPHHWNQSFMIKIPREIKSAEIEKALKILVKQHDMLRCNFHKIQTSYQQQYHDNTTHMGAPFKTLNVADLDDVALYAKLTHIQSNFNYFDGPLWQAAHLTHYQDGSARLFFAFHHLIIDTVSWRIIAQDVIQLLTGKALPAKGSSYRQWVGAVQNYALTHQQEREYWQTVCVYKSVSPLSGTVTQHTLSLTAEQTDVLLHQANLGFHTQINDLLLSALAIALSDVFASRVNHITLEGHGREVIDDTIDVKNTVGWFTSAYPVRLETYSSSTETIIQTKEMLNIIPNKGIGYSALFSQQVTQKALAGLPQIVFNYLGQLGDQNNGSNAADWQIVAEDSGQMIANENSDSLLLNINGAVQCGALQFTIASRSTDLLSYDFATRFQKALIDVIKQAALKAKSGGLRTLSDLKEVYLIVNEKSNDPIFVLPPGDGGAESYLNNIVPQLKDRKIILFNNLYLEGGLKNDNVQNYYTFERLAIQYIRYIKKIQPVGPYELFGWSFGGVLAFEIARQLENNGDKISKIILIDPYFNYKKVIEALCQDFPKFQTHKLQDNINYQYQCNNDKYRTNAEIVLFKFSK
ncbi:MAG: hypothetical protein KAH18_00865, partial [Psychromonas sp.]|nr:hypothetical protein [Psychromonas sp.]